MDNKEFLAKRQELEAQLLARAWADADFKAKLLSDPKAAIQEELGIPVPSSFEITVVEETTSHFYLALPINPEEAGEFELSTEDLESVAGGICLGGACA